MDVRWFATLTCVVGLATTLASCGTHQTIVKTVTVGSSTKSSSAPAQTTASSTSSAQQAALGDTLTLHGNDGETMNVTVNQLLDPLPVGPVDQADSGDRYVGVQITLKNVGSTAYSDSPGNGSTLLSNTNEQAKTEIVSGGPCGNDFQSSANIAPGATQQGCIPFELPTGQQAGAFQFTLNSGFADQTGQWSLAGARPSGTPAQGQTTTTSSSGTAAAPTTATPPSGTRPCDQNISVGSDTSCPFAENVFQAVVTGYQQTGSVPSTVTASSPVTHRSYSLSCGLGAANLITCTSSTNSLVTFPESAVQAAAG